MPPKPFVIGVVAPSCRITDEIAAKAIAAARALYSPDRLDLRVHPQCFLSAGHFAGPDSARLSALVETANDPSVDAVWFARGGYGACRIAESALARLSPEARAKPFLGYSDAGFLLAGLLRAGCPRAAHGPMLADIQRDNGSQAVERALRYLVEGAQEAVEPHARTTPCVAFNITILSCLLGTPLEPDLTGRVLMLEEVSEHMYRIDRALFHITSTPSIRRAAGLRLGRCSQIPPNDPDFSIDEVAVARHWCAASGLPWLGSADIGHDAQNRVVPFAAPAP